LLSTVENQTPVLSEQEMLMHQQMEKYKIQLKYLERRSQLLNEFVNGQQQQQQQSSITTADDDGLNETTVNEFLNYYRTKINGMKMQLDNIEQQQQL